ncbi:MAG: VOC family protein [Fimbriimonadaceae bacterium]
MSNALTSLILDVHDMDRSLKFYHDLLSLPVRRTESFEGHELAYLSCGSTEILLMQQPVGDQSPVLDRTGGMVLKFAVRDLPLLAKSLESTEVQILRPVEESAFERTFLIADPDGYAILLSERVDDRPTLN